ncbi:branched-chain amino acid ABC transporter permease [Actinomadura luteofluorescens]|uniref:branched-chain amino acid ABC transporter permease n=1 Tax=Actinomadura luteofluorescens TaxID=46163 RepID=UPI0021645406|nr:branched-chain amino acid ABC transporter permease [Actinomadura glauciflava]MCR3745036.1 branched-chain amino acid transport system permease protein [Actinomadura glauciflava]
MDVVITGAQVGAQYALLAIAVAVMYSTTRVVNFAIGTFAVAAVYVSLKLAEAGWPALAAVALGCLAAAVIAVAMEIIVAVPLLRRLPGDGPGVVVVASILVLELGRAGLSVVFGPNPLSWPSSLSLEGAIALGDSKVTHVALVTYAVSGVVLAAAYLTLYRTGIGAVVRAVAERPGTMGLVGVNASRVRMVSWGVAGLLSGVAGILLAGGISPSPGMMVNPLIGALAGVAVGGLTSLLGSALGAFAVGITQTAAAMWVGSLAFTAFPVILIIVVLVVRPQGLFGRGEVERA